MSDNKSVQLDFIKGRTHYVTISESELAAVTSRSECCSLGKKYGLSGSSLWRQICSGNRTNRTFPIFHLVPHLLSREELYGDLEELKRIVRGRELDGKLVRSLRSQSALSSRTNHESEESLESDADPIEVPRAPPQPIPPHSLASVYATRTNACFGLHLLTTVQAEDAAVIAGAAPHGVTARAHLQRLPMSELHRIISELCEVRHAWERDLLAPAARALADEMAHTEEEQVNALLFHICLWQRRYPLEMLLAVLSFHSEHREYFRPVTTADPCEPQRLEMLMEELLRIVDGQALATVPGLLRCDVLMSYPTMPLAEQITMMQRVAAACRHSAAAVPLSHTVTDDAMYAHSRAAMDPQRLLAGFTPAGCAVPPRFCAGMPTTVYRQLRSAFERHKRDGVRRLAAQAYAVPVPSSPPGAPHTDDGAQKSK